jgi:hypothetical protein
MQRAGQNYNVVLNVGKTDKMLVIYVGKTDKNALF